ncbi:hypothetical protein BC830DRAFT_1158876 [Chytriomyces sp. MP71]|nr:hypothetical protein BC830DRAFT_1158876 [Chytriomyces sp. MP71]
MPSTLILCAATATLAVAIAAAMVHRTRRGGRDAVVVVLGDLGHSPRMCLHAQSLADRFQREHSARRVRVVSYLVSAPPHRLAAHPFVAFHPLRAPQRITAANPLVYVATAALRILVQLAELARILFCVLPAADVMLVQNPPAIPTLAVAQLVRILRGTRLIIDWHNFGFSIMAMGKSSHSPVVKLAKWYEMTFGRNADGHLCVTQAMANHLKVEWNITGKCVTLYDRSPSHFRRLSLPEAHDFLTTLEITSQHTLATTSTTPNFPQTTLLTTRVTPTSMPAPTTKRPALIVSSTSWTPDEDFSILLDALARYDASAGPRHADLVVVVTGKGPLKAHYEGLVRGMRWTKVRVLTAWLRVEDYPRLLGE